MISLQSHNPFFHEQIQKIPRIARSGFPVLLLGPSGAGKELVADSLHASSRRPGKIIKVNCSALTETLIESELFGHHRGAFTGATENRKGAFESARGGTLFLDEIGDLPYAMQSKLLRALENNEIKPVGSDRVIQIDVRIIAATHKPLEEKIHTREFREDLYYRLNVINITLPPLRSRMEDFEQLFFFFAEKYRVNASARAIQAMKKYSWPGNIRELKNVVARASVLHGRSQVTELDVSELIHQNLAPDFGEMDSPHREKTVLIHSLRRHQGNQRKVAQLLGIPKSTLHDRLRNYGIDSKDFRV